MEILAYEMQFSSKTVQKSNIRLEPFRDDFYFEYEKNIYVLWDGNTLIGSVACYGNEIDDLIVNKVYQNKGVGRKPLIWAIEHIRSNNNEPIVLHVAKWNEKALKLYLDNGFEISKIEKVR